MNIKQNTYNFLILSLFSPVLVFYLFVKRKIKVYKRALLIILVMLYGVTIPMTHQADGYRHQKMVDDVYYYMSFETFIQDLINILSFEISSSSQDIYIHFVSYFTGGVLGMPFLFFYVISFIYGYFYSGVVLEIFKYVNNFRYKKSSFLFITIVMMFILNKNIEGIQTVRTWTGMWALFYFLIKYDSTKSKKYLFLLLTVPIMIHFGYAVMALPTYFALIFRNKARLFSIFFFISFFFTFGISDISKYLPKSSLVDTKTAQYGLEKEEVEGNVLYDKKESKSGIINSERTWYKRLHMLGYFIYPKAFIVLIFFILNIPQNFMTSKEILLYSGGLLTITLSNVLSFISAASNRMEIIGFSFLLASLIMLLSRNTILYYELNKSKFFKLTYALLLITFLPQIIWWISFNLSQVSLYFIFAPFIPMFSDVNISAIDAFKSIFR